MSHPGATTARQFYYPSATPELVSSSISECGETMMSTTASGSGASDVLEDEKMDDDGEGSGTPTQADHVRQSTTTNFIQRLQHVLGHSCYAKYIRWNQSGTRIVIPDSDAFTANVLSKIWRTHQFTSFIRQLNNYNFHKTNRSTRASKAAQGPSLPQSWEFEHRDFKRDVQVHWSHIRRKVNETAELANKTAAQGTPDMGLSSAGGPYAAFANSGPDFATVATRLRDLSEEHVKLKDELREMRQYVFSMWTVMQAIPGCPQVPGNEALDKAIRAGLECHDQSADSSQASWSAGPSTHSQQAAPYAAGSSPSLDPTLVSSVGQEDSDPVPSSGTGGYLAGNYAGRATYEPKLPTCQGDLRHNPYLSRGGQTTTHLGNNHYPRRTAESARPIAPEPLQVPAGDPYMLSGGRHLPSYQPHWSPISDAR